MVGFTNTSFGTVFVFYFAKLLRRKFNQVTLCIQKVLFCQRPHIITDKNDLSWPQTARQRLPVSIKQFLSYNPAIVAIIESY